MATRGQLQRVCDEENRKRRVDIPREAVNSSIFCNNTTGGFSVIGSSVHKDNVVLDYVTARLRAGIRPVVIISNSDGLERKLIQYVRTAGGTLAVESPSYRDYSIFSGMTDSDIVQCVVQASRIFVVETAGLVPYLWAFLTVMRACAIPVSLHSMIKLSNSKNSDIMEIARAKGVREDYIDTLKNSVAALDNLRTILNFIADSVQSFADPSKDSGRSLTRLLNNTAESRDIIFIRPVAKNPELISFILGVELQAFVGRSGLFVFDNVNVECEKMKTVIESFRSSPDSIVGECIAKPSAVVDDITQIIPDSSFVLFPGGISPSVLHSILTLFGPYVEHNVQETFTREAFHLFGNKAFVIARTQRDRIMVSDMNGAAALLGGDKGVTLTIARNLTGIFEGMNTNGALTRRR